MSLRLGLLLVVLGLLPGLARAGNDTYCVSSGTTYGDPGACGSDEVRAQHARWHFHCNVTDGSDCYQCFDERDNTCETDFLRNNPGWSAVSRTKCMVLGAPPTEQLKFHVVAGKDVTSAMTPAPPRLVTVETRVETTGRGPFAVGDTVQFRPKALVGGELRPGVEGTLVVTDPATGEELSRLPVDGTGPASIILDRVGELEVRFEPRGALRGGEEEAKSFIHRRTLRIAGCGTRTHVRGVGGLYLAGDAVEVSGELTDARGDPLPSRQLQGGQFVLRYETGREETVAAVLAGGAIRASIPVPDELGPASIQLVAPADDTVCPGDALSINVSAMPLSVVPEAPAVCWTGRPCRLPFVVQRPVAEGPAAARAAELLADPGLEVLARLSGQRVTPERGLDTYVIETIPAREGTLHADVELLWDGTRSVSGAASVEVRESIELVVPSDLALGDVPGGDIEGSCVPLSFDGSRGALGSRFSVRLAEPCASCEAELVSVVDGQVFGLPLDEIVLGEDHALPICLRVGRCPTGDEGATRELIVTPLEPLFADQERRVSVSFSVARRSALDCWAWLLWWILGGLAVVFVAYGWIRPQGFEPGTSVRLAGSEKHMRRAPRLLLEEQRGGKKGWYRSARVRIDGGGAPTTRRREAAFTFVPHAGGVGVRGAAVLRQDRRSRRFEPVEAVAGVVGLQRGRQYEIAGMLVKLG